MCQTQFFLNTKFTFIIFPLLVLGIIVTMRSVYLLNFSDSCVYVNLPFALLLPAYLYFTLPSSTEGCQVGKIRTFICESKLKNYRAVTLLMISEHRKSSEGDRITGHIQSIFQYKLLSRVKLLQSQSILHY